MHLFTFTMLRLKKSWENLFPFTQTNYECSYVLFYLLRVLARVLPNLRNVQSYRNQKFKLAYKRKAWSKYLLIFLTLHFELN